MNMWTLQKRDGDGWKPVKGRVSSADHCRTLAKRDFKACPDLQVRASFEYRIVDPIQRPYQRGTVTRGERLKWEFETA